MRVLILILALLAAQPASALGWVGTYIWGGLVSQGTGAQQVYNSVNHVLVAGFDTVRLKIGPSQAADYGLSPDPCPSDKTLACYARAMLASSAWDNPGLKRVMVTAHDFSAYLAAGGNSGYLNASVLTANATAIKAEYVGLIQVLYDRFSGRGVQIILSNWEGDNLIFCGSAFDFGRVGGNAATCQATFPAGQTNVQRIQNYMQWLALKDQAVSDFLAAHPDANVIHAPEFNNYKLFAPGCSGLCDPSTDTLLKQFAASGGRQYCSYSSYDTQGPANGSYLAAVQDILTICQNLIIGEAGYDLLTAANLQNNIALYGALDQIRQQPGVLGVIPWNAFNPASLSQRYGLFSSDGSSQLYHYLGPLKPTPQAAPLWR
jgi:hypothetical protein